MKVVWKSRFRNHCQKSNITFCSIFFNCRRTKKANIKATHFLFVIICHAIKAGNLNALAWYLWSYETSLNPLYVMTSTAEKSRNKFHDVPWILNI